MRRPFTPEEDAILLAGRAEGLTLVVLAKRLGRCQPDIRERLVTLCGELPKLPPAKLVKRPCLCCGQAFASQGAHNRLCVTCRRKDDGGPLWRYA